MSLAIQKGFWGAIVFANTRNKLTELYHKNPNIAESEKRVILEYWQAYEGLSQVLGDKLTQFTSWFLSATSPETVTRCLRSLKEDGTIKLTPDKTIQRQEREQEYRQFWGNEARQRGEK